LKKTVVTLSALLLLVSSAAGNEKCAGQNGKAGCSRICGVAKDAAGCAEIKTDTKTASGDAKHTPTVEHSAPTKAAEIPPAPETGKPAVTADEVQTTGHERGEKVKCVELDQFHAAMHPMALAMGFEGDAKPDMKKFRALYPKMKEKTDALAKMSINDKGIEDTLKFVEKRAELVKFVDELGVACKSSDDSKIGPAFEKVHEAYINLAMMVR